MPKIYWVLNAARLIVLLPLMISTLSSAQSGATEPIFGSALHNQTIQLSMDDDQFDGQAGTVHAGDIVRFVITNRSGLDHGFAIGTSGAFSGMKAPDSNEDDTASIGSHSHELPDSADAASPLVKQAADAPSLEVPAGMTRELLVQFPRAGKFSFACSRADHAGDRMSGVVTVLSSGNGS